MRVGLVTWWFNRGQATAMRTIRAALDERGHETFVLARPTADSFDRPAFVASDDVWEMRNVTRASASDVPAEELIGWAETSRLQVVLFFQNLDHGSILALRQRGMVTAATYMWEAFGADDVAPARQAVDRFFALNRPTARFFRQLGIDDVWLVPYCAHPDFAARAVAAATEPGGTRFVFMAGYLRARKPLGAVLEGFVRGAPADATLTVKSQIPVRAGDLILPSTGRELASRYRDHPGSLGELGPGDPRIRVVTDDLPEADFVAELQRHDVVVGVSRWEGLGLHLYESEALGIPLILNGMEPYLDFEASGGDCELVDSTVIGTRPSGVEVHEPDIDSLAEAFHELGTRERLRARVAPRRDHASRWMAFVDAVDRMVSETRPRPGA